MMDEDTEVHPSKNFDVIERRVGYLYSTATRVEDVLRRDEIYDLATFCWWAHPRGTVSDKIAILPGCTVPVDCSSKDEGGYLHCRGWVCEGMRRVKL